MNLSTIVLIAFAAICCLEQSSCDNLAEDGNNGVDKTKEMTGLPRRKRMARIVKTLGAALDVGNKAVKTLLRGAKEIPTQKQHLRDFVKSGDYKDALGDFNRVHPRNVQSSYGRGGMKQIGEVGDRTIILTRGKKSKERTVTIEIIKSRYLGSGIERITYIDKK